MTQEPKKTPRIRVAAVIKREDGSVLLVLHRKGNRETWLFPGGGVDWGESARAALVRELNEELGLTVKAGELRLVTETIDPNLSRHLVALYFEARIEEGEITLGGDPRVVEAKWFLPEEITRLRLHPPFTQDDLSVLFGEQGNKKTFVECPWI